MTNGAATDRTTITAAMVHVTGTNENSCWKKITPTAKAKDKTIGRVRRNQLKGIQILNNTIRLLIPVVSTQMVEI